MLIKKILGMSVYISDIFELVNKPLISYKKTCIKFLIILPQNSISIIIYKKDRTK